MTGKKLVTARTCIGIRLKKNRLYEAYEIQIMKNKQKVISVIFSDLAPISPVPNEAMNFKRNIYHSSYNRPIAVILQLTVHNLSSLSLF